MALTDHKIDAYLVQFVVIDLDQTFRTVFANQFDATVLQQMTYE